MTIMWPWSSSLGLNVCLCSQKSEEKVSFGNGFVLLFPNPFSSRCYLSIDQLPHEADIVDI